jgi:ABC-type glycerol-3-phosphate transport system substrate-binding protein
MIVIITEYLKGRGGLTKARSAGVAALIALLLSSPAAMAQELTFLGFSDSEVWRGYWRGAIARYEATAPGVHIKQLRIDHTSVKKKALELKVLFDSGAAPDLYIAVIANLGIGVENGWAAPLDDYISRWADKEDIIDPAFKRATKNGVVYGIGHKPGVLLFIYRKDFFEEAGLDPAAPPETWEALAAAAERLTKRDGGTVVRSGMSIPSDGVQLLTVLARQNGGEYLDANGKPAIDDPAWVEALEFLTDLVRIRKVNIISYLSDYWKSTNLFLQGRSAIAMLLPYQVSILLEKGWGDRIGVLGLGRKKHTEWSGAWIVHVSAQSKHKDTAWRFIEFLMSPDEMWQRYQETANPVVRHSLMERYFADDMFLNRAQMRGIEIGAGAAKVSWFGVLYNHIGQAMEEAFHEGKPPAQALREAKARVLVEIGE